MKVICLILLLFIMNEYLFTQENQTRFYSRPELRFTYRRGPGFGVGGFFGVQNEKMRGGLGFAYESSKMKVGGDDRNLTTLPIILRSEVFNSSKSAGFCTELGYGMSWMKNFDVRNSGFIGMGFTFVKGHGSIMFRRHFISVKQEKNINLNQIALTIGIGS